MGLDSTGFTRKTTLQILEDIAARQHASAALGPNQDTSESSALGQINATIAGDLAELWELAELVWQSDDPDGALDVPLENLSSLTGTLKRPASASRVIDATLNIEPGETVPAGSQASVFGRPDLAFTLDADVTNPGASAADFAGNFTCTQTGPIVVNPSTLTVIDTPVSGWNSVTNSTSAAVGRDVDSNAVLRARRVAQLAIRGGSTVDAIRADLLDFDTHPEFESIESVIVLENRFGVTDDQGLPPHSFEAIVDEGPVPSIVNNDICQAIWDSKPAGIESFGSSSGIAFDSRENARQVFFSIATRLPVYITFSITTGLGFPGDGMDQVKAAFAARGGTLDMGDSVIALYIRAAAFEVAGVVDVPDFAIGYAASPTEDDNLGVTFRERAVFDAANMVGSLA